MMKNTLIVILGPTASGKTAVSINLAKQLNGEIISSDSMQIYRHMDIGTAKVNKEEMSGVKHHIIDIINPDEEFSAADFQKLAYKKINDVFNRNKVPLLAGGTGLYINSVIFGYDFIDHDIDYKLRQMLKEGIELHGNSIYHEVLRKKLPEVANKIHVNNTKRLIRAWEVYLQTGEGIVVDQKQNNPPQFNVILIGLKTDRDKLYRRIDKRVKKMIDQGLIEEVTNIVKQYKLSRVSRQAIGYKEVIDYLRGLSTYDEMLTVLKRETRNYAKRQLTWFRKLDNVCWFNLDSKEEISVICKKIIECLQDNTT